MSTAEQLFGAEEEEKYVDQDLSEDEEDERFLKAIRSSRSTKPVVDVLKVKSESSADELEERDAHLDRFRRDSTFESETSDHEDFSGGSENELDEETTKNANSIKKISLEEVEKQRKAIKRSGVIYLSRIPPYMAPNKLRQILSQYGKIGRVYLTPESSAKRAQRLRNGGNKRVMYEEGWIEFESKRVAKSVAELLNTNQIGGKKSSWYHDDIWNMKYLPKFKWHHLTEQIAAENAARESRLKVEIEQGRKQLKQYMRNVENAKMIEGIRKKRSERDTLNVSTEFPEETKDLSEDTKPSKQARRFFGQKSIVSNRNMPTDNAKQQKVENVLRRVF
ncbi:Pre-rRNA-processing protein esf2 [Schizosaccharomyces pombe]|uniref:Pre-rRNA-processing protein esf2 n=1 Tax=Schizosaccharomyces pombe (strain 972 / ATCC 24843) TaxID=284812 RepID=ESF2_SCHPO|nr:putative U3 snoRNP-associated protein Esf2 [Schizosaccharomyces pombe]O74362.1 RecName: Full=Pre-rRNA-processing protein esf2; AltName: Full=18S rRNA factor 2 [Schizosaccharomyces pombe 972h-]CAA20652.1 U3 snoRNP-associated protein Esf2 (predicted) [Schizosaccharomyces pombe]|eukprot:NP_595758.1 putative U3 snoRNP-associated protein Esf2 [Schizosaccharomyces pombe]